MGRFDDEDLDETPVSKNDSGEERESTREPDSGVRAEAVRKIKRGWGNAKEVAAADSPFAQRLKLEEGKEVLIKFIEDDPYTSYRQHWLDGRKGQKSFTCISDFNEKGCPLCKAGSRPSAKFAFNVAEVFEAEDGVAQASIKSLEIGPRLIDQLSNFHTSDKTGPLTKHYWIVSRTGKGGTSQTSFNVVKERDLGVDEWEKYAALTAEQLDELRGKAYDASIVPIPAYKTLKDIADEEFGS